MPPLSTGVPNLDLVLGGGVPSGSLVLVMGAAGTGKTTLALQMAFQVAAADGSACFVSTTSESPERLLEHARSYGFYDEARIGKHLILLSVFPLIDEGLQPVQEALEREVREHGATLLVLDGLTTLYDLHADSPGVRRFLYELSAAFSNLGCTLLVTSSQVSLEDAAHPAELTMADVLLRLTQPVMEARSQRLLQVVKVRGQTPLPGVHSVRLDHQGLAVFPRFESLASSADLELPPERVTSGLPELDAMLSGGLPRGSITAVAGAVGTGKTLLGLQFLLEGVRHGEIGALLSLRETKGELIAKARTFRLDLQEEVRKGRIVVVRRHPVDLSVDALMQELDEVLDQVRPDRFVLDGVGEILEALPDTGRHRPLLRVIADLLLSHGITALVLLGVPKLAGPELDLEQTPMAALAHNLVFLRYAEFQGELHRIVSILKARDSHFDPSIRRYVINEEGMRMLTTTESPSELLAGIARLATEAHVKRSAEQGEEG